jgi:alpha-ketoglutarate-dependent taurine dioxygenase
MVQVTSSRGANVETRPVSPAFGTEFLNLDLREEQPPDVVDALRRAFFETSLVLVRGQDISFEEQQRFASYIGRPTKRLPKGLIPGVDELPTTEMYISNTRPEGFARAGALLKHSDYCFEEHLLLGICLYGEVVTASGGATIFVSAKQAAERLPAELRRRLDGRDVRHVFDLDAVEEGFEKWDVEGKSNFLSYTRPALLRHPVTAEEIVYVNELMTDRCVGMSPEESDQLLSDVYAVLDEPDLRYEHTWAAGDVIVWDNIKLQHGRTDIPEGASRSLRRMMLDAPA